MLQIYLRILTRLNLYETKQVYFTARSFSLTFFSKFKTIIFRA